VFIQKHTENSDWLPQLLAKSATLRNEHAEMLLKAT